MKRFFSILACLAVILSLSVPVFATGGTEIEPDSVTDSVLEETTSEADDPTVVYVEEEEVTSFADVSLDDSEREWSADSIPAAMTALFGEYTPRTQTVTEYYSDGTQITYQEIVPGVAGLDWPWLSSVGVFAMGLYCIFRAIGGCLKWI